MTVCENFKVILSEEDVDGMIIEKFKNPRSQKVVNYATKDESFYELIEINKFNSLLKESSKTFRSLILEENGKENGLILEDSTFYMLTKFNFVFILINFFNNLNKETSRFQSLEDLIDFFSENGLEVCKVNENIIKKSLNLICEVINEGNEEYFKFSNEKVTEFLTSRVSKISENFPDSILEKLIKPKLYPIDINDKIPEEILKSSILQHSIKLISNYISVELEQKLEKQFEANFIELNKYIEELAIAKKKKKLAQEQLENLNSNLNSNGRNDKRKNGNNSTGTLKKSAIKKAKVTKGPLDSFWGKK